MKKIFSTRYSDHSVSVALLLLRLASGGLMIHHGFENLIHFSGRSAHFSDPLHIGAPVSLSLTIFAEFFCAVFVVLGLMTRLASIPLIICMSVALFYVNQGQIFGLGEAATLYLAGFTALLLTGPGKISVDHLIGK